MNSSDVMAIRNLGRVVGFIAFFAASITIFAILRLLCSPVHTNPHHPRLRGTFGYFYLLLVACVGDALVGFGIGPLSMGLAPPPALSYNSSNGEVESVSSFSCVAQGFFIQVGAIMSVTFAALLALELYFIRPQITPVHQPSNPNDDPALPCWRGVARRANKLAAIGFFIVLFETMLGGFLYGYGDSHPPLSDPWCWVKVTHGSDRFVTLYTVVFCSAAVVVGSFYKYLSYLKSKFQRQPMPKTVKITFAKLAVYPLFFLICWVPAMLDRLLILLKVDLTDIKFGLTATHVVVSNFFLIHIFFKGILSDAISFGVSLLFCLFLFFLGLPQLTGSLGTVNFVLLGLMNRQVREYFPSCPTCILTWLSTCCCCCHQETVVELNNTVRRFTEVFDSDEEDDGVYDGDFDGGFEADDLEESLLIASAASRKVVEEVEEVDEETE
jgi:hypothetical protein